MTAPTAPDASAAFCRQMLPKVSRTFAICIRLLPGGLEHSVLIAYLLCRIADTIEDTTHLDPDEKVRLLHRFRDALATTDADIDPLRRAFSDAASDEERLAYHADAVLAEYRRLPSAHRDAVRPWVQEMSDGMAEFVDRGRTGNGRGVEALATVDDLDRYCYFVAGTVGHLLTELFRLHHPTRTDAWHQRLRSLATSFGLGLQLTNIIKDIADDRRRGWSFVPRQLCQLAGIRPEDLQDDGHREGALRVMRQLIDKAKGHLLDALEYSTHVPRSEYGIRLFCLTSLYFAVRTLRLAESDPHLLDPSHKVKITRAQVYRTILVTRLLAPVNSLVRGYFRLLAGERWWKRRALATV